MEVHLHHQHATSQDFLPPFYDAGLAADYDVNPSCRFSYGTSHICFDQYVYVYR